MTIMRVNPDLYRKLDASPFSFRVCLRKIDGARYEVRNFSVCFHNDDLTDEEKRKFIDMLSGMIGFKSNWFIIPDKDDEIDIWCKQDEFI